LALLIRQGRRGCFHPPLRRSPLIKRRFWQHDRDDINPVLLPPTSHGGLHGSLVRLRDQVKAAPKVEVFGISFALRRQTVVVRDDRQLAHSGQSSDHDIQLRRQWDEIRLRMHLDNEGVRRADGSQKFILKRFYRSSDDWVRRPAFSRSCHDFTATFFDPVGVQSPLAHRLGHKPL
jgi:hypothetical protein